MNPTMRGLRAVSDWRSWAVFRRHAKVYFHNWKTAFLPPALEPVVFFLAFGLGLGTYIGWMVYEGREVSYPTYVAPGMIAYAMFNTPFFEGLYSAYVRMFYQKTWDGIMATQVELEHIVWGEILWAAARGVMNSLIMAFVLAGFMLGGALDFDPLALLAVPVLGFFAGWAFASFALIFTAIVPSIDHMNYPVFLVGIPLGLISNTYFPLETERPWLDWIIQANPVYHLAETLRALMLGASPWTNLGMLALTVTCCVLIFVPIAQRKMRARLLA